MIKMPSTMSPPSEPPVEMGRVVEVLADHVRIQPEHHSACEACGSSTLCFPDAHPSPVIEASCSLDVQVGDLVSLRRDEAPKIGAALALFGIPVAGTLAGVIAGLNAAGQEAQGAVAGALAGLLTGIFIVRTINKFVSARGALRPAVDRVLGGQGEYA